MQSDEYPFLEDNNATFPVYEDKGYQLEVLLTQYLVNNVLYELHKEGYIKISTGEIKDATVGLLQLGIGGTWKGFNENSTCEFVVTTNDPYPNL